MPTATKHRPRMGDLLMSRRVITEDQLAHALEVQQRSQQERLLGEILVELGYASQEQVLSAVAQACGVPYVRLTPQLLDPAIRSALPETFTQKHGVLALFKVRDVLTVAVSEPSNAFLADEIAHAAGLNVQVVAATPENIYQMMDETRPGGAEEMAHAEDAAADLSVSGETLLADDYDSVYGDWPPEKIASLLVREAVRSHASAIHLEPDEKVLRIRFRVDGRLHIVMRPPARLAPSLASAFDEMMGFSGKSSASQEAPRSARLLVHGRPVQVHVVSLGGAFGPRMVVRLVRDDEAAKPLEKLGCDFEPLAALRAILVEGRGLVLMAGPRESGVTTTLYSALGAMDPVRLNVCTFESCVNFNLPGVNQFSPATCGIADPALALARLRGQQPDVLAIDGVMNDGVAAAAIEAALDGCLVLVQVRAADAADAIAGMMARAAPEELARALRGVVSQRLVRTICLHCRGAYEPPATLRRAIAEAFGPVEEYVKGRGCNHCGRTGFLGQIGLFEFAPVEGHLTDLVRAKADRPMLRDAIRAAGCSSLWVDGINKVRAGITSIEEVMEVLAELPGGSPLAPDRSAKHRGDREKWN